jgi:hypothetical protein
LNETINWIKSNLKFIKKINKIWKILQ